MSTKENGIKRGCLYAILLPFIVFLLTLGATVFIYKDDYSTAADWKDWSLILLGHFAGLSIAGILFFFSLIVSGWLSWKDPHPWETIKLFWPLILSIFYFFLPDFLPGWWDDTAVTILLWVYQIWKYYRDRKKKKEQKEAELRD